jgi:putative ABC transport system substrate-binding protein
VNCRPILLLLLLALALPAVAADLRVAGPPPFADEVARLLRDRLPAVSVARAGADARVTIAVGAAAFREEVAGGNEIPVIGLALTRQAWRQVPPGRHTAVFWDPDPVRQLRLLRALMPGAKRVGIVGGNLGEAQVTALAREARRLGLALVDGGPVQRKTLARQLNRVLADSDVLLGIDDPLVFAPDTGKTVLLTSYRHGKPVIGPSAAWVEAGSVASLASRLPEAIEVAARWIPLLLAGGELPAPAYPASYGVETNASVARSLQLTLPSTASLESVASAREETHP